MNLLDNPMPVVTLRPDVTLPEFLDRCESIAASRDLRVDRNAEYGGPGYDMLDVFLGPSDGSHPVLRMLAKPRSKGKLELDILASWGGRSPSYDEYLATIKSAYAPLLDWYRAQYGRRLRLGVPKRPTVFDPDSVNCTQIIYAHGKFREVVRSLAVGPADVRARLRSAFWTFHVVRPENLPPPLDQHLRWVIDKLNCRQPRFSGDGTLDATVAGMQRRTGVKIAERILALTDALDVLYADCRRRQQ